VFKILGDLKIILGSVENWTTEYCIVVKVQKFCSSTDLTPWRILRLSHQGQQETGGGVCCLRLPGRYCVAAIQVSGTEYVEHGSPIQLMCNATGRPDPPHNVHWRTAMSMSVCLSICPSVCPRAYLRNRTPGPRLTTWTGERQ